MGIKNLNRFLLDNCTKKSIKKTNLKLFANKTLVIDTSIYLYKFVGENTLIESMYLFISVLKSYDITPIFIFDGKPPPEKKDMLIQRRNEKLEAENRYMNIQKVLAELPEENRLCAMNEMEHLKKQFIRIKEEDIRKVKELLDCYGISHYVSPGEADQLCAHFVQSGKAWGCISDDMDMFLYGCNHIIRHISLLNHTVVYYDMASILKDLKMTQQNFREIMVLSGTDYNTNTETNLFDTIKWFYEYNKYAYSNPNSTIGFYDWLSQNTKYITDYEQLLKTNELFNVENYMMFDNLIEEPNDYDIQKLRNLLETEGFVFAPLSIK
jgi:hypothetical protein